MSKQMITIPVEHYNYLKEHEYAANMMWNAYETWKNEQSYLDSNDKLLEAMFEAINNVFTVHLKEIGEITIEDIEINDTDEEGELF